MASQIGPSACDGQHQLLLSQGAEHGRLTA